MICDLQFCLMMCDCSSRINFITEIIMFAISPFDYPGFISG
jgi:hypothetical protein